MMDNLLDILSKSSIEEEKGIYYNCYISDNTEFSDCYINSSELDKEIIVTLGSSRSRQHMPTITFRNVYFDGVRISKPTTFDKLEINFINCYIKNSTISLNYSNIEFNNCKIEGETRLFVKSKSFCKFYNCSGNLYLLSEEESFILLVNSSISTDLLTADDLSCIATLNSTFEGDFKKIVISDI